MEIDRVVIVTGASQGLGAATASCLASNNVAVSLVARSERSLLAVEAGILEKGGHAMAIQADVADPEACQLIVKKTLDRWGRLDALVDANGATRALAAASMAKAACSELALEVISRLMDRMGPAALEPEWGMEKAWRDAKLTQIYEGTNQLNRLCFAEHGVGLWVAGVMPGRCSYRYRLNKASQGCFHRILKDYPFCADRVAAPS